MLGDRTNHFICSKKGLDGAHSKNVKIVHRGIEQDKLASVVSKIGPISGFWDKHFLNIGPLIAPDTVRKVV